MADLRCRWSRCFRHLGRLLAVLGLLGFAFLGAARAAADAPSQTAGAATAGMGFGSASLPQALAPAAAARPVPATRGAAPLGLDQATTLLSENFEGTWPSAGWQVSDLDGAANGEYFWAVESCRGHNGSGHSAWGIGGGAQGGPLAPCSVNYPDGLQSAAVYGPLDLSRATAAELRFSFWVNTHCIGTNCVDKHDDRLWAVATKDQNDPNGWNGGWFAGPWTTDPRADANGWVSSTFDLKDYLGESEVYIGFSFESDLDGVTRPGGAFIDDVQLTATLAGCPAATAQIRSITLERGCYAPGATIGVLVDVGTSLVSQNVRAQVMLLSGDIGIGSAEATFTAPGQRVIALPIPADAATGDFYTVFVKIYDLGSDCLQTTDSKPLRIDPACGVVTPVVSPSHTPTPSPTPTATRPPTHTPTATASPQPTSCPMTRPQVPPSCAGINFARGPLFEKPAGGWNAYSTAGRAIITDRGAVEGFRSAYFEAPVDRASDELLLQAIDIPADASAASFWVGQTNTAASQLPSPPPTSGRDYFRASLYDATLTTELVRLWQFDPLLNCPRDASNYNLSPSDLDRIRGRSVLLVFELRKETGAGWATYVVIDDIHFHVCSPSPPCHVERDKTASPSTTQPGGEVTVLLTLSGLGGGCAASRQPADVVLVIDRSGSMSGQPFADAQTAAKAFVDRMDLSTDQVGLVSFSTEATLDQGLTQAAGLVRTAIDDLSATGDTNITDALTKAQAELTSPRRRPANQPVLILMSDGQPTSGGDPRAAAAAAKAAGTRIFTIGLGSGVDPNLMRELASAPGDYFFAPDSSQLDAIYQQVAGAIGGAPATNITIVDRLSPYVTLVPGSFIGSPAPEQSPDGKTLTWRIPRLGLETLQWGYRVKMTQNAGTWPTNDSATATYTNSAGQPGSLTFPVPQVTVVAGSNRQPQVICRDHVQDHGGVPSNLNGEAWWDSPDIWVRNQRDGQTTPQQPLAGQTNWIYVRVKNVGDAAVGDVQVHVYRATGAANIRWPADWMPEISSTTISSLAAGQEAIVSVPWLPTQHGHHCFLVRIEAPADKIMQDGWVPFDNNICQRNVHIVDAPASAPTGTPTPSTAGFGFGNRNLGSGMGKITVTSNNMPSTGSCTLTFTDPDLFRRWQAAGGTMSGGQVIRGTSSIQVDIQPQGPGSGLGRIDLSLGRVPLQGEERSGIDITVTGPAGSRPPTIDIRQQIDGRDVGGNIIRPPVAMEGAIFMPYAAHGATLGNAMATNRQARVESSRRVSPAASP